MVLTLPSMRAFSANTEDIVVPLLTAKSHPFGVVGHTGEFGPKSLVMVSRHTFNIPAQQQNTP